MSIKSVNIETLAKYKFIYSIAGLILGLICIFAGVLLILNGFVGSVSWTAKALGLESDISDAGPGAILFIVGLFIVFITRYSLSYKKKGDEENFTCLPKTVEPMYLNKNQSGELREMAKDFHDSSIKKGN